MSKLLKLDNVQFVQKDNDVYISGVEICKFLGYKEPSKQASQIFDRNKDILKKYSVPFKLKSTDGKAYNTRCYNERGVYFFIAKCNIKKADEITEKLIDCFVTLKTQITSLKKTRDKSKKIRYELTDAIKDFYPSSNTWIYKNLTDLAYYMVFGKNAKQLRIDNNLKINANVREFLNNSDLQKVSIVEKHLEALVMNRLNYAEIKERLKQIMRINNIKQINN